jgi:glycosyltransferase involved in cell wall biosynthesis
MGASSRLRTYQFLPYWKREGYEVSVLPFFNESYLKEKYLGQGVTKSNVLICYLNRLWILMGYWKYDLIWVEKELFPFLPAWAEWLLSKLGKGYVVDYDDAVFHRYDMARRPIVRQWLGKKIDGVMRHADIVWAGNSYLGNWAKGAGAKNIVILPTVIDPERYAIKENANHNPVVIGWIGSPTTLKYLNEIRAVLERLSKDLGVVIHVVGGRVDWKFDGNLKVIQWTEDGEVSAIQQMDIGVMPLPDDPWEKGKCAYKLIQYMACGLPVVASPVGMNVDVVVNGENGYLAKTQEEWYESLKTLILDEGLRKKMGQTGFDLVQERFTIERNFEVIMRELGGKVGSGK